MASPAGASATPSRAPALKSRPASTDRGLEAERRRDAPSIASDDRRESHARRRAVAAEDRLRAQQRVDRQAGARSYANRQRRERTGDAVVAVERADEDRGNETEGCALDGAVPHVIRFLHQPDVRRRERLAPTVVDDQRRGRHALDAPLRFAALLVDDDDGLSLADLAREIVERVLRARG